MSQNLRWTEEQFRAYAQRRLGAEPKAMEKIQRRSLTNKSGYNVAVVLNWFRECGLPPCVPEYRFLEDRRFRFDFAWLPQKVYVEIQGGIFSAGAHVRGAALLEEHAKRNLAACAGWRGLFCVPSEICTTDFAGTIRLALAYEH